jgi:XTP/dITP diphosphohydrolase
MSALEKTYKLDRPLVLGTRNRGKIGEFKDLFGETGIEIRSLDDFGPIPPVVENGKTFEDNAVLKACFTARVLGLPAIADDSGLTVKALGGEPGILSARYAGEGATDRENNLKLLSRMEEIEDREAAFVCILAIAVPRGPALIYEGICEGLIAKKLTTGRGFGYDPLFYYPPLKKTFAQMTQAEKNRVSHRGKAMEELRREIGKVCIWLRQRLLEEPF